MNIRIKICGITNLNDAITASELGADALGFIFVRSKRMIAPKMAKSIIQKLPPFITTVGVFMDTPIKTINKIVEYTNIDGVQLHGDESPEYCSFIKCARIIKRIKIDSNSKPKNLLAQMKKYQVSAYLFDPGEGSGITFDWRIIKGISGPVIIAGGLTPDNIGKVINILKPYGVDVCSGVEKEPGKKDPQKLKIFIQEARLCSLPV